MFGLYDFILGDEVPWYSWVPKAVKYCFTFRVFAHPHLRSVGDVVVFASPIELLDAVEFVVLVGVPPVFGRARVGDLSESE